MGFGIICGFRHTLGVLKCVTCGWEWLLCIKSRCPFIWLGVSFLYGNWSVKVFDLSFVPPSILCGPRSCSKYPVPDYSFFHPREPGLVLLLLFNCPQTVGVAVLWSWSWMSWRELERVHLRCFDPYFPTCLFHLFNQPVESLESCLPSNSLHLTIQLMGFRKHKRTVWNDVEGNWMFRIRVT